MRKKLFTFIQEILYKKISKTKLIGSYQPK